MSAPAQRRQARDLVRLREVRLRAADLALAEARAATARAEAARDAADAAVAEADARSAREHADLAAGPAEAEARLALLDHARFKAVLCGEALSEARASEEQCGAEEQARRKAMIVARARHDALADRVAALAGRAERRREEREQLDAEDVRRFR
jgi:hypothetical protein